MARFRFRLQTLRRLREIDRDELRLRLATAYEAERILHEQQRANQSAAAELAAAQRSLMLEGVVDVNRLLTGQRYQLALDAEARTLAAQAAKLADEVERRRQALVEADRRVRTFDRLEQRQRDEHRRGQEAAEAKRLDEIGATRWEGDDPWA